jgi:hypothetical protein
MMSTYEIKRGFPKTSGSVIYVEPSPIGAFILIGYVVLGLLTLVAGIWVMTSSSGSQSHSAVIICCSFIILLLMWVLFRCFHRKPLRLIQANDGKLKVVGLGINCDLDQCNPELSIHECRRLDVSRFTMKIREVTSVKSLWLCLTHSRNKKRFCLLEIDVESNESLISQWQSALGDLDIGSNASLPYRNISVFL